MIKSVIFDMDGLLINSEPFWRQAEREIFADLGITLTDADCERTMGWRFDEVVHYWYKRKPWSGMDLYTVEQRVVDRVITLSTTHGEAMPGVYHALDFFSTHVDKLALASSSAMRIIQALLDHLKIKDRFDVIHSAEYEMYGKPHPGIFITTAERLNVNPTECLVIEDSLSGVIAAKAARMFAACVPDPTAAARPQWCIADIQLASLEEWNDKTWAKINTV